MKIRLFLEVEISENSSLELSGTYYNYLVNVLKTAENDEVFVFNGSDGEFRAVVTDVAKKKLQLCIREKVEEPEPLPCVELLCPLLKKNAFDMVIQKATELGVGKIIPVQTDRTNANHVNLERMKIIATEAAEQSRRVNVPKIEKLEKLDNLLKNWNSDNTLFFLDETGRGLPIVPTLEKYKKNISGVSFLIGPEGGFSEREIERLYNTPFAKGLVLDKHILRAETAVCAALSIWKYI